MDSTKLHQSEAKSHVYPTKKIYTNICTTQADVNVAEKQWLMDKLCCIGDMHYHLICWYCLRQEMMVEVVIKPVFQMQL